MNVQNRAFAALATIREKASWGAFAERSRDKVTKQGAPNFGPTRKMPTFRGGHLTANLLEDRMGFEPMNTGFADQRVSHFAIGPHLRCAHSAQRSCLYLTSLTWVVSLYGDRA
jgi:hypothetical protein